MRLSDYQLEQRVELLTIRCQWLEQRKELQQAVEDVALTGLAEFTGKHLTEGSEQAIPKLLV